MAESTARNPNAIPVADLAAVLAKLTGQPLTAAHLDADRVAGAPVNPDGTIHLVHYAAWLVREEHRRSEGVADGE